jgi:heptosyltransferase-3
MAFNLFIKVVIVEKGATTILRIVIFRLAFFGDILVAFPILRELRAKYKNDFITFVSHPASLPLAQAWGLADEVQEPDKDLFIELYADDGIHAPKTLKLFQQTDLAISLMRNCTDEMISNLLAAGVKEVIAASQYAAMHSSEYASKHVMEILAESIGMSHLDAGHIASFTTSNDDFCLFNRPIAIHPGRASDDPRCWLAASYVAVIHQLVRRKQPVLLLIGPDDTERFNEMQKHLTASLRSGMLTIMRNAPILQVAQTISKCKCYLGSDSGMTHLAALTGVPTIILSDPSITNSTQMGPLGPSVELIETPLKRLSVDWVLKSILKYV